MKRMIRNAEKIDAMTTEDGRWYPDDDSYRGLKETEFAYYTGNRWVRVFVARDGSLWYRFGNRWCRTYADYCSFSPKGAKYSYLHASNPEHVAEFNRISEEAQDELRRNDNRGY